MIGIISALDEELQLFLDNADVHNKVMQSKISFHFGTLEGHAVILLKCGVGKVNAAIATQLLIDRFGVDSIIFTGMAGGLVPYIQKQDIVISNFVVQYDVDLTAFGRRPGEIPELSRLIEADPKLIKSARTAFDQYKSDHEILSNVIVGTIACGDTFVSDSKKIQWLQTEFGAVAAEMEGGAVGQVCQMNNVPFVIIRIISDVASETAASEFIFSLEDASKSTFGIVQRMLQAMPLHEKRELFAKV